MAKVKHYYSEVAGHIPASLLRGQIGITIPDQTIYANTPDGKVQQISNGKPGVANARNLLGVHIPWDLHPVAQLAPGYTQAELQAKWSVTAGTGQIAVLQTVPLFIFGKLYYTPVLSCPVSPIDAYKLVIDIGARNITMASQTSTLNNSGTINPVTGQATIVIRSDGQIYPWFYLQASQGDNVNGDVSLYRISPYKTFGAIPVSQGFAGAKATSYWGAPTP